MAFNEEMMLDLSVVIPVYNAEKTIEKTVSRVTGTLDSLGIRYEVLLRNDGSLDGSGRVMERVGARHPSVRCFSGHGNKGLGATLRHLFQEASGTVVLYCDCDLPFGDKILPILFKEAQQWDIVVASRYAGIPNHVPWGRKVTSRIYHALCKLLFNISVADIGSGTVAIRKVALHQLDLQADGFGIHAELFVKSCRRNFTIKELPAESAIVSTGSFRIREYILPVLCETLALWLKKL